MPGLTPRRLVLSLLLLTLAACAAPAEAPPPATAPPAAAATPAPSAEAVAPSDATRSLFDNLAASSDHAALVAALRNGGMVNRLRGEGPFIVFAPTDAAFAALPEGTLATLLEPDNKPDLVRLLNAHIVYGRLEGETLADAVAAGGGKARFATAAGTILTVLPAGAGAFILLDDRGDQARVLVSDLPQANGVVHVIDSVLRP